MFAFNNPCMKRWGKNYLEFCLPPQLGPQWAGRTCGLCGNYNGNQGDDFLTGSGLVEASPHSFGQAWRINGDCESTQKFETDPCAVNPKRGIYTHTDRHHSSNDLTLILRYLDTSALCRRGVCSDDVRRVQSVPLSGESRSVPAVLSL